MEEELLGIQTSLWKFSNEIVIAHAAAGPTAAFFFFFPFQMTEKICLSIPLLLLTRLCQQWCDSAEAREVRKGLGEAPVKEK